MADKDLAEWNASYRESSGKVVIALDEILALFGPFLLMIVKLRQ